MGDMLSRLREHLVEGPASIGAKMRNRRWLLFENTFPQISEFRVLDLGGTASYWHRAPVRPRHVTVVNLTEPGEFDDWIEPITGDACTFEPAGHFDLVVSNSLLEHVGGYARRQQLSALIQRAAGRHWVQTPYRYFPIEPHWLFPGMQFLPVRARVPIAERWPLIHTRPESRRDAIESILWTELLSRTEIVQLFPNSRISFERMLGVPKSLLAIQAGQPIRSPSADGSQS